MTAPTKIGAVIVAAGSGLRFGDRKQFKNIGGRALYLYSLHSFLDCNVIAEIILVVPNDMVEDISKNLKKMDTKVTVVGGGEQRQDSVLAGINALSRDYNIVVIHDAARPIVSTQLIEKTINAMENNDGVIAAIPSSDTVKDVSIETRRINRTLPRDKIWLAQTPQVFNRAKLVNAFKSAKINSVEFTDEASLMESLGYSILVVEGNVNNFKITTQQDWELTEILLENYYD